MEKKQVVGFVSIMILICANYVWPQSIYPLTLEVPVTFYDFHSDGTNPEFEQPHMAGVHLGMVADTLDSSKKPFLGLSPYLNYGIAKWFRPWVPGDFTVPSYQKVSGGEFDAVITYAGMMTINSDTSYKNIVIQDSLTFQYVPGTWGIFEYSDSGYFPLDGRGFGNEGFSHNYSFTMHFTFPNLACLYGGKLEFEAGDDMWIFIDGKLVKDLGGIHAPKNTVLSLDSVPVDKPAYHTLDVFCTQRHSPSSRTKMQLCLVADLDGGPLRLLLNVYPALDSMTAGDSVQLFAGIIDQMQKPHHEFDSLITWQLVEDPPDSSNKLRTSKGGTNTFYAFRAYEKSHITISCSVTPVITLVDTMQIFIKPGLAFKYYVEPYTEAISPTPNPIDSIVLGDFPPAQEIYAVKRDAYGGFAGFDSTVTWEVLGDSGIVKLTVTAHPWVCLVEKVRQGTTYVVCKSGGVTAGTVKVMVRPGTKVVSLGEFPAIQKPKMTKEYFNLRGQKFGPFHINNASGIIFERITSSDGSICIRKINSKSAVRYNRTGGFE